MECAALFVAHSLPRGELSPIVGRCAPIGQKKWEKPVDFCVKVVEFVAKVVGFRTKSSPLCLIEAPDNANRPSSGRTRAVVTRVSGVTKERSH